MTSNKPSNESKYTSDSGRVFLSGNQALVRLPIEQAFRDREAGLNTAGFVSGYRGSPLGHLDQEYGQVGALLKARNIHFQPGINEDMAATAVWGTQQVGFFRPKVDGVFGLWYSKGPGVDRSGDALRHANLWGTSAQGGVIMAVGDDPMSRSSSIQQQSEQALAALCIPVFSAGNVQDIYDFGLIGWQLSRYAGVWVAVKAVSDIYESWYPVDVDRNRMRAVVPADHRIPHVGVHTRWPDRSVDQDERMLTVRLPAVRAFARANQLNRVTHSSPRRRYGIITAGKSWSDTIEALRTLGIDDRQTAEMGLEIFKIGMIWPLEPTAVQAFAEGLDEILVLEECRPFLEPQVKDVVFNMAANRRPRILGKRNNDGAEWLPSHGELDSAVIARVLYRWLQPIWRSDAMEQRIDILDTTRNELLKPRENVVRNPYYCSGCPHNTSTKIPEGSKQLAGIGCHWLVTLMDRDAVTFPQMGGEGATWAGAAHFLHDEHVFANVGDGTWYHSGSMAIRQAVAANLNITFKILYNDAVAMTGGQPVDGPISVEQLTYSLYGEGIRTIAVVSSDPEKFDRSHLAPETSLYPRDELDRVQKDFRQRTGVSVIVYEQTCATELRRRRNKKLADDPQRRVVINDRVCEGCGDCSVQSNCLSLQPLETEFGRKRTIDQSACNKDFSCIKGFCPSFVTIEGGQLRKANAVLTGTDAAIGLPEPLVPELIESYGILVAGIGGTGVVTIANIISAAAQLDGKYTQALDLTGLSQKFGSVYCHLKITNRIDELAAPRLSVGTAELLIGADIVTAASDDALSRLQPRKSRAIINDHETVTGAFTKDPDFRLPLSDQKAMIERFCNGDHAAFYDTTKLSEQLTGDSIGANMMLLGFAFQKGWIPVSRPSLEQAIRENGVAVGYNLNALGLGRVLAQWPEKILIHLQDMADPRSSLRLSDNLEDLVRRRSADLVAYQNEAYAKRYRAFVDLVRREEVARVGTETLSLAIARNFYKLMAYKDEYEVARLYTDGGFLRLLREKFAGNYRLKFHFAPPFLSTLDSASGRPRKREFGQATLVLLRVLARLKFLRGTPLDIFGYSADRRVERLLIDEYEKTLTELCLRLSRENHAILVELAEIPQLIRGFGLVKEESVRKASAERKELLAQVSVI